MTALIPTDYKRRSFVYRSLIMAGARLTEQHGAAVAHDFGGGIDAEANGARLLGLADLSPLPRIGFKGRGTLDWLAGHGVSGLDENNMAYPQGSGSLVARLAPTEVLVLGGIGGNSDLCERLGQAWHRDADAEADLGCYPVLRREANSWFVVSGAHSAAMFAKLCAVDLRPDHYANGQIAQTSLARTSAIIVRADLGTVPAYAVFSDSSLAKYLWDVLVAAMMEFDGQPVGVAALQQLTSA
ncbi:MAG: hypothetical protein VCD31_11405 [Alphaproteobacteria bacterium]